MIEHERLNEQTADEVDQEFAEFQALADDGIDPATRAPFATVRPLLTTFLERNVPDDDELLVGWLDGEPKLYFPDDPLVSDARFLAAAAPLVEKSGSTRIDTDRGEVLIASQPVRIGNQGGALLVVIFLEEDRSEIRNTMRTYAIVGALSLALIVAIAFWQAGRLLAPLRTMRQAADEITETDLSRRLPLTGNDDVTALTRTFNGMLDRLDAAFTGQRQLLDDAGHELRTPLTILQGHLELLDADNPVEVAETRDLLLDEIDRMRRLVDDLILLAKTERPGFLHHEPVDVAALTESTLAKATGLADRDWSVDEAAAVTIDADSDRITQALLQMAHNAVKHTGPGDTVALGSAVDDGNVLFWVRDTGSGVDAADRERIFERFGRGHDTTTDGFGLGLAIVTGIARAHGGTAWLDDAYHDGARFCFSIPFPTSPTRQESF
ncbi:sensor histidine kinase [Nocardioides sp. GXZ039]|uniref:sensor histidine kinase n=1 Tax=Nocardioides sp. GXZ039 TaxID=3136018 RepID=UPI0030F36EDD